MSERITTVEAGLYRLESRAGLSVQMNSNGSLQRIDCHGVTLNLFPGNELEGGPTNIYLRIRGAAPRAVPLLGPGSPASFRCDSRNVSANGEWQDLRFRLSLVLAESTPAWFWHLSLENRGSNPVEVDVVYLQDLALAHYGAIRLNEYYVSQYLDHEPLLHPRTGWVVASRQNQAVSGRYPWVLIGGLRTVRAYATDARQIFGHCHSGYGLPAALGGELPSERLQHEHSLTALQTEPMLLAPGKRQTAGFFGWHASDHPAASSADDLAVVERALALPEARWVARSAAPVESAPAASWFTLSPPLDCQDLTQEEINDCFDGRRRCEEWDKSELLSFFHAERTHVVLLAKAQRVLRPHGQIIRSGDQLTPDEAGLTSTQWMRGVFHSMLTQGHVSINRLISAVHGYLGLFRSQGVRVFVETESGYRLLDMPSAFAMDPSGGRWLYRHAGGLIEVKARAGTSSHDMNLEITVRSGPPQRFLISAQVAVNGDDGALPLPVVPARSGGAIVIRPVPMSDLGRRFPSGAFSIEPLKGSEFADIGGDELLFPDGVSRNQPYVCLVSRSSQHLALRFSAQLVETGHAAGPRRPDYWRGVTAGLRLHPPKASPLAAEAARLGEIFPWLAQNALLHYLSPRGLEQYSGGGWGTRDVTQGPVEYLLGLGRPEPVRDLLLRVFRNQNPDGDWPQWFMFFDRERNIRPGDSHGDIVFWPLLALAQYLLATDDRSILDEIEPYFHPDGPESAERASLWSHVERACQVIAGRCIPNTHLAAYGHGDWNDSLQPADPALRERLCSSWTVILHYQTCSTLAEALRQLGRAELAARFGAEAETIATDFQRLLMVDGIATGFAEFADSGVRYLVHPRDNATGLSYSLLPMIHGVISGLFTPEQAASHLALVRERLSGPDGVRLFDKPLAYHGGIQRIFQRAESASYFGREIGLMYTHAHLRYAEALAVVGDADGLFRALCLANPIGLAERSPSAAPRQANCYYSSSDAAFRDRYQAYEEYDRALSGEIPLEGGWRVYSSGAGIMISLIVRRFLGIELRRAQVLLDPVIPLRLDGLAVNIDLAGRTLTVGFRIKGQGHGPRAVRLNGQELPFTRLPNPYRTGGAAIDRRHLTALPESGGNVLEIELAG